MLLPHHYASQPDLLKRIAKVLHQEGEYGDPDYLPLERVVAEVSLAPCTLHLAPCTLHPAPCTLHLATPTLHPPPSTLHCAPLPSSIARSPLSPSIDATLQVQSASDLTIHLHCAHYKRLQEHALPPSTILDGGKVAYLAEHLPALRAAGHRCLIFSQVCASPRIAHGP